MDEKMESGVAQNTPLVEKASIGDVLRKQRISLSVSIEKIAKDLKISKNYVQAIENNDFSSLPGISYARIYVKTIAEYLSIDPADLLKQLNSENNPEPVSPSSNEHKEVEEDGPINVSLAEEKKNINYKFILFLVFLLVGLAVLVLSQRVSEEDSLNGEIIEEIDSMIFEEEYSPYDTILEETEPEIQNMEVVLNVARDSSWIEVIADGVIVREGTFFHPNRFMATARDTIVVRIGAPAAVELSFGGTPINLGRGAAMSHRIFTQDTSRVITAAEWRNIRGRAGR